VEWGLEHISSREITEWMASYTLDPWGEGEAEWRAAMIAATVANTARDDKKKSNPYQPADFMRDVYKQDADKAEKSPETLRDKIDMIFKALGGTPRGDIGKTGS
jgi:hypothetical protein